MRHLSGIDLRLIRILCTIMECSGFPTAKIALNIAQPTLSTQLASLEAELGTKLCERSRAEFRITPAGKDTHEAAQDLLRNIERFQSIMNRVHHGKTAKLRIGVIDCVTTFKELYLTGVLARFAERHPKLSWISRPTRPPALRTAFPGEPRTS